MFYSNFLTWGLAFITTSVTKTTKSCDIQNLSTKYQF